MKPRSTIRMPASVVDILNPTASLLATALAMKGANVPPARIDLPG